jgi:diguanylate cyclase (GGDEF)-like protein
MTRRGMYALLGAGLSLGGPAGLFAVRAVLGASPARALREVRTDLATYLYVLLSTATAFSLFGGVLGWQADRLLALSISDPLTRLKNRRFMGERLEDELARSRRYGSSLALLLIDVDRLKEINDASGHAGGDRALVRVADAIRGSARATDVAARWGGDEFTVLAPNTDARSAAALAERIRAGLAGEPSPTVTVSIGVASSGPAAVAHDSDGLLSAADAALYSAKAQGRDRVAIASSPQAAR